MNGKQLTIDFDRGYCTSVDNFGKDQFKSILPSSDIIETTTPTSAQLLELIDTFPLEQQPEIIDAMYQVAKTVQGDLAENFNYKRKWSGAPYLIPLDDIVADVRNFQNRRNPWSKHSVEGIIAAIENNEFIKELFNPIIVWRNGTGENIILAGHSRYEAFLRLKKKQESDPILQERCKKHDFYFDRIPAMIINDIDFQNAKTIALMSNALATVETDLERANVYRYMRIVGKDESQIEKFGKTYEKTNWNRIRAFSYLNPDGLTSDVLNAAEGGSEVTIDIYKIAAWIGELRRKYPQVSNIQERELYEWLSEDKMYGKGTHQISTKTQFVSAVGEHIKTLEGQGIFDPDKLLNIKNIKKLPLAMKYYLDNLQKFSKNKSKLIQEMHELLRSIAQKKISFKSGSTGRELYDDLENALKVQLEKIGQITELEKATQLLFDVNIHTISDAKLLEFYDKQLETILEALISLEVSRKGFKQQKERYERRSKDEQELFD